MCYFVVWPMEMGENAKPVLSLIFYIKSSIAGYSFKFFFINFRDFPHLRLTVVRELVPELPGEATYNDDIVVAPNPTEFPFLHHTTSHLLKLQAADWLGGDASCQLSVTQCGLVPPLRREMLQETTEDKYEGKQLSQ